MILRPLFAGLALSAALLATGCSCCHNRCRPAPVAAGAARGSVAGNAACAFQSGTAARAIAEIPGAITTSISVSWATCDRSVNL